jgi:hypothetical protein
LCFYHYNPTYTQISMSKYKTPTCTQYISILTVNIFWFIQISEARISALGHVNKAPVHRRTPVSSDNWCRSCVHFGWWTRSFHCPRRCRVVHVSSTARNRCCPKASLQSRLRRNERQCKTLLQNDHYVTLHTVLAFTIPDCEYKSTAAKISIHAACRDKNIFVCVSLSIYHTISM